jgi:hypothetical protein
MILASLVRNGRSAVGEKFPTAVRSILIFDDHPECLRLLCQKRPSPDVHLVAPRSATPARLMLVCF